MTAPDDDLDDDGVEVDDRPTWLDGLAMLLDERGLGAYRADGDYPPDTVWPIYLEHGPPTDRPAIILTGYAGDEARADDEPRVQVMARGDTDPRTSRRRAQAVYRFLHELAGGARLGDGTWLVTAPGINGGAIALGVDGNRRHRHVTNHRLTTGGNTHG